MTPDELSKLAFLLYPHLATAERDVPAESLAARIKDLQKGLLPEDEFAATVCWLGNCAGIHRIDQTPMPLETSLPSMRAPDFIAFAQIGNRRIPALSPKDTAFFPTAISSSPANAPASRFASLNSSAPT